MFNEKTKQSESQKTLHLTSDVFDQAVGTGVVLVDFWAAWCGPCRMMGPIIDELAAEYDGRAKVAKVNVDEENALAVRFGVMSIPTLILFKDGKAVEKMVGAQPKASLKAAVDRHV